MNLLRWSKPDDYHIRSACGRFSVARITVKGELHYIAWSRMPPITEIGSVKLPATSTDDERLSAIRQMQALCESAAAGSLVPPPQQQEIHHGQDEEEHREEAHAA